VKQVRAIFVTYVVLILLGIAYCTVLGLIGR
jgi:hypothetical protein